MSIIPFSPVLFQDNPLTLLQYWGSTTITEDMRDFGQILTCDELHSNGVGKLSHIIRHEMEFYFQRTDTPLPFGGIFSHTGFFRWDRGVLWVSGAVENGFRPRRYRDFYAESDHIVIRERFYNENEVRTMVTKCLQLESINWSYQYWGLLQAEMYARFGWNWFKRSNEKYLYCYEGLRRIKDSVFHYNDNLEISMYDKMRNSLQLIVLEHRLIK